MSHNIKTLSRIIGLVVLVVIFSLIWVLHQQLHALKKKQAEENGAATPFSQVRRTKTRKPNTPEERYLYRYLGAWPETLTRQDITGDGKPEILAAVRSLGPDLPGDQYFYSRAIVLSPSKRTFGVIFDTKREIQAREQEKRAPLHALMKIGAIGTQKITIIPVDQKGGRIDASLQYTWDPATAAYQRLLLEEPDAPASPPKETAVEAPLEKKGEAG